MKRFGLIALAASAVFAAPMLATAQTMSCQNFGKGTKYVLDANTDEGIPTFKYGLTPKRQECEGDKNEYFIVDTFKGLDSVEDAGAVVNALRTLRRTGFTDPGDIAKGLKFVDEVEKADATRPKKKVAGSDQGNTKEPIFPFGEPKKK